MEYTKFNQRLTLREFTLEVVIILKKRWWVHLSKLKQGIHHSIKLQRHYNKYGIDDLVFIIIEPCFPEFLIIREQFYLDQFKPYFNSCFIASSTKGLPAWNKGIKLTKEQSKNTGRKKGAITWMKGKHHTNDSLIKMRKPRSEEARKNIKKNNGLRGKIPRNKGLKFKKVS